MKYLLILFAIPCLALDGGLRIYDAGGSTQTSQPRTVRRYFARGEFPTGYFPRPRVGGTPSSTWQVDVESTWPDGSILAAAIALPVSIAANGSAVVDFVRDANPCHLGDLSTCQAAGLDQAGMLAFNGAAWGAVLQGTANGITYSANARTMMSAGAWTPRRRGPLVTEAIVEDLTRPDPVYDFGWEYTGGAWQAPSGNQFKSVHPIFDITFYAGWAGVEVEVIALQAATTRFQRQVFDLLVTKNGGTTVYSKSAFDLPRSSGFNRYFWDGTAPAAVQIDFNLKHMIYSRMLPPFDYTKQWSGSTDLAQYDTNLGGYDVQDCNPGGNGYCGSWYMNIPGTGGRGDIGLIPRYYTEYLVAMGDTTQFNVSTRKAMFDKLIVGNADAGLTLPTFYLEYDNSAARDSSADGRKYYFDAAQTTPAFGRTASMWARAGWRSHDNEATNGSASDNMVPVCTSGPCNGSRGIDTSVTKGWQIDLAHMPSLFSIPYMLTGRYSYLLGQISLASYMAAKQGQWCSGDWLRCGDWGLQGTYGNQRSAAWTLREIAWAALLVPSNRPEREYFRRILEKNDEMWEGVQDVYGGNADATNATNFCRGTNDDGKATTATNSSGANASGWGAYRLNGVTRVVGVEYPIYSVTVLSVDGVDKTVGVKGVDTGRDWYYYPGGVTLFQDDGAATVGSGSTVYINYRNSYDPPSPWCSGRHIQMKGMPNPIGNPFWTGDRQYPSFMMAYYMWVLKWIEDTQAWNHSVKGQPLFKYSVAGVGRYVVGWGVDPAANPHFADMYRVPNMTNSNTLPTTWTERMAAFPRSFALQASMDSSTLTLPITTPFGEVPPATLFYAPTYLKIENEWVLACSYADATPSAGNSTFTICAGGRGKFGTTATSHASGATVTWDRIDWNGYAAGHSYPNLFASSVAMYEEYSTSAGTGRRAWERVMGDLSQQQTRATGPEYAFVPRDRISTVRAKPGTGTLALSWVAPSGEACKVLVSNSDFTSFDDASDNTATSTGRNQTYSATGLSAGTAYYRVTCGTARINGTATIQ